MSATQSSIDGASPAPSQASVWARLGYRFPARYRMAWLAVGVLAIVSLLTAPAVFGAVSLHLVTALGGVLLIASLGQLLVVMLGGVDLSVPAVMTLAAAIVVHQTGGDDGKLAVAIVEVLLAGTAVGFLNGVLVAIGRLNPLIVTLAMGGIVGGVTVWWTGTSFSTTGSVPSALRDAASSHASFFSTIGIAALAIAIVF
jgi:ribose transport system permease protein